MNNINAVIISMLVTFGALPLLAVEIKRGDNWDEFVFKSPSDFDINFGQMTNEGISSDLDQYIRPATMLSTKPLTLVGSGSLQVLVEFMVEGYPILKLNNLTSEVPLFYIGVEYSDANKKDNFHQTLVATGDDFFKYKLAEFAESDEYVVYQLYSVSPVTHILDGIGFIETIKDAKVSIFYLWDRINITIKSVSVRVLRR